ncbi:MAG: NADH-quinone oxidoreductase subunit D, partial [Chitinophagales bacterium]
MQHREKIYEIWEEVCGSRLTTNIGRIGGLERDFNDIAWRKLGEFMHDYPKALKEFEKLFTRNRIFMDRTIGAGPISAERAMSYGFTGPNLRAAGVDYDVRASQPYSSYEDFDFVVPVGTKGDTYDRYLVRNEEMKQSLSIIRQAIEKIDKLGDKTSFHADVPQYYLPEKSEVYNNMEALIYQFKIVMGEIDVPKGEVYHAVEGANGELGFYVISEGGRAPYRLHFRRPCFIYYQAFTEMVKGQFVSDAIVTLSSLNVIAGELDA